MTTFEAIIAMAGVSGTCCLWIIAKNLEALRKDVSEIWKRMPRND